MSTCNNKATDQYLRIKRVFATSKVDNSKNDGYFLIIWRLTWTAFITKSKDILENILNCNFGL